MNPKSLVIITFVLLTSVSASSSWYYMKKVDTLQKELENEKLRQDSILAAKLIILKDLDSNKKALELLKNKVEIQNDYISIFEENINFKKKSIPKGADENLQIMYNRLQLVKTEKESLDVKLKLMEQENKMLKGKLYQHDKKNS
jgi:hypothetical protein